VSVYGRRPAWRKTRRLKPTLQAEARATLKLMPVTNATRREFIAAVSGALALGAESSSDLKLWYRQPAKIWTDALPVGNGRLGAMVFGGVETERLALNEDTLWSGSPKPWNNRDAKKVLPEVRRLVAEEKYHDADILCKKMQGPYNQSYLPLGNLILKFDVPGVLSDYRRELDLDSGIASVIYRAAGAVFTREVFCSAKDRVMVVRLTCDQPGKITVTASVDSPVRSRSAMSGDDLRLYGKAPAHVDPNYFRSANPIIYDDDEGNGMRFESRVAMVNAGGTRLADGIGVEGADAVTLFVAAATGYKGFDQMPDGHVDCRPALDAAVKKSYAQIRAEHIADHQKLFRRVTIDLGGTSRANVPTDERLKAFQAKPDDPGLLALYFQYGRYLLIASSRPGSQPANLQGIWNDQVRPPWSSNWTANMNVQMNYWPAETCNLSECHEPLFDLIEGLSVTGAQTAKENYGALGWVSHHNVDLWRQSAPVGNYGAGDPKWANWPMSGPWFCAHLWEHYLFTEDRKFLERVYPVMKGAAEFCVDWLIEDQGKLTTCPSFSPENVFRAPDGRPAQTSAGCTMDMALIRELFANCIEASKTLGVDTEFRGELSEKRGRLIPYQIGKHGQLQEWSKDFDEPEPGHRHMAHLYPLHPGSEFTQRKMPEFWRASRVSLERRIAAGGGQTGWSRAWAINFWARLCEGDLAHESLCRLLDHSTGPNLFDTHPAGNSWIFQIDGNFGGTAAVAEMLLQSHEAEIHFLPALPKAWPAGEVRGLRARGNATVDIAWKDGRATEAVLRGSKTYQLRAPKGQRISALVVNSKKSPIPTGETVPVRLAAGDRCVVSFT
jgi:alpha-L-fucosidase 2